MTIVNFDQAATSYPKPESVYATMDLYYRHAGWSVGRSQMPSEDQLEVATGIQETRRFLCELFETNSHEVVFTATATEAINVVLKGLSEIYFKCVYTTPFEHRSVTKTLKHGRVLGEDNIRKTLAFDTVQMVFDLKAIEDQFKEDPPTLLVLCHLSNVLGALTPVQALVTLAKTYGALVIIDACQSAGRVPLRATADFVVFSGHKSLMGPFGIAGFLMPINFPLQPLMHGGNGIDVRGLEELGSLSLPLEVGTQNSVAILGLRSGLQWLIEKGVHELYKHELAMTLRLYHILEKHRFLMPLYGSSEFRPFGIVSCQSVGVSQQVIAQLLAQQGILIRAGRHCSDGAHELLGTWEEGLLRFSINAMTTDSDFERLEEALFQIEELL